MNTTAKLISMTPQPLELLKEAAGQCYQKEASNTVIKHIIEAGHLSVLEHCYATFKVSCSLLVLLQLTRHRHLSFTVQSSRGSELHEYSLTGKAPIDESIKRAMGAYYSLVEGLDYSYSEAAYVLPKAVHYNLVVTGNFRAWFEYLPKRLCKRASTEHQELAQQIYQALVAACPEVFGHVKPNCQNCKERKCTY